jgi:hypothetical protein
VNSQGRGKFIKKMSGQEEENFFTKGMNKI